MFFICCCCCFYPSSYTSRGWHEQDGVIDLSKASCQTAAFGNETLLLGCSGQHSAWSGSVPLLSVMAQIGLHNVMWRPWQARLLQKKQFENTFSALSSKWPTWKWSDAIVFLSRQQQREGCVYGLINSRMVFIWSCGSATWIFHNSYLNCLVPSVDIPDRIYLFPTFLCVDL